jgi:hypothetical protein
MDRIACYWGSMSKEGAVVSGNDEMIPPGEDTVGAIITHSTLLSGPSRYRSDQWVFTS